MAKFSDTLDDFGASPVDEGERVMGVVLSRRERGRIHSPKAREKGRHA